MITKSEYESFYWIFNKFKDLKPNNKYSPFLCWVPYFYNLIKYLVDADYSKTHILEICDADIFENVGDRRTRYQLGDELFRFTNEYIEKKKQDNEIELSTIQEEEIFII